MPEEIMVDSVAERLKDLKGPHRKKRIEGDKKTIKALAKLGTDKAFETIIKTWVGRNAPDFDLSEFAQKALQDKKALNALVEHGLKSKDHMRAMQCTKVIREIEDKSAIDDLIKYGVDSNHGNVPGEATAAIGWINGDKARDTLLELLSHHSHDVNFQAAHWLGNDGTERELDAILEKGFTPRTKRDPEVFANIMNCLGRMGQRKLSDNGRKKASEKLIPYLKHSEDEVVRRAAWSLGFLAHKKGLVELMKISGKFDEETQKSVKDAIQCIQEADRAKR